MNLEARRRSIPVKIGGVTMGGAAPIVVQSMTNTDTADVDATAAQVAALARTGSELVRITVDREEAAAAVPHIRDKLLARGVDVPIIGDFHYNGHTLLAEYPACAEALAKYRINPGNVGFKDKRDRQFSAIIDIALRNDKPVRIGVNWGSLDQDLLTRLMDENAKQPEPKDARAVMHEAIVQSALLSAERAVELGLGPDKIVLSAKVSAVQDLIQVYAMLGARSELALHLGLTEAGMGSKGIVASSAALAVLLQQGIGDTIRISLTPEPNGDRTLEVKVAQEILQSMGFRSFVPLVAACPGCGRTTSTTFQELARDIQDFIRNSMPEWKRRYPGVETLTVAVMGCIVNGPGEFEARRHRHLASRHRRGSGGARLHRRQEGRHLARSRRRSGIQADGDRLYRAPLRPGRPPDRRGVASVLDAVADQADGQGNQGHIEEERHDAVHHRGAADSLRDDGDVGDLERGADGEGKIDEVQIVGRRIARENKTAALAVAGRVELVCVMQREHGVDEGPGQQDREKQEAEACWREGLGARRRLDPGDDGTNARGRGHNRADENGEASLILLERPAVSSGRRCYGRTSRRQAPDRARCRHPSRREAASRRGCH